MTRLWLLLLCGVLACLAPAAISHESIDLRPGVVSALGKLAVGDDLLAAVNSAGVADVSLLDCRFFPAQADFQRLLLVLGSGIVSEDGQLADSDAGENVTTIVQRVRKVSSRDWFAVVSVRLAWKDWKLTLTCDDAAVDAKTGIAAPPVGVLKQVAVEYPTGEILLPAKLNSQKLAAGVQFAADGIRIIPVETSDVVNWVAPTVPLNLFVDSDRSNASSLRFSYQFINQMLRSIHPAGFPLVMAGKAVSLTNLNVAGSLGALTIAGTLVDPNTALEARATYSLSGDDLVIGGVEVDPTLQDCSSLGLAEKLKCEGQNSILVAAAKTAGKALREKHVGVVLRPIPSEETYELSIGSKVLNVSCTLYRTSSTADAILLSGHIEIRK